MAGSLDDLDKLLEEELVAGRSVQKISLEEQVLSRVSMTQKDLPVRCTQTEQRASAAESDSITESDSIVGTPLERFLDRLIPFLEDLEQRLRSSEPFQEAFANSLRSRLAEELISLPDVAGIEKAGVFAAVASCLDAGLSGRPQRRLAAQERISKLLARVESARSEGLHRRMLAAAEFAQQENVDLKESS